MQLGARQTFWHRGKDGNLPSGYTELEYIEYYKPSAIEILTNITPTINAEVYSTFQCVNPEGSDSIELWRSWKVATVFRQFRIEVQGRQKAWDNRIPVRPSFYAASGNTSSYLKKANNALSSAKLLYVLKQPTLKIYSEEGVLLDSLTSSYSSSLFSPIAFVANSGSSRLRFFSMLVVEPGGIETLKLYPAERDSDKHMGVFDTVGGLFIDFSALGVIITGA